MQHETSLHCPELPCRHALQRALQHALELCLSLLWVRLQTVMDVHVLVLALTECLSQLSSCRLCQGKLHQLQLMTSLCTRSAQPAESNMLLN